MIKFYVIRKIGEKNSVLLRELKTVNDIEHFTLHAFEKYGQKYRKKGIFCFEFFLKFKIY